MLPGFIDFKKPADSYKYSADGSSLSSVDFKCYQEDFKVI